MYLLLWRSTYQRGRFEVLHDRVVSDRQVQLVANQHQPAGDGVGGQVEAGPHDNSDDAEADGGAGQRPRAAFKHLYGQMFDWDQYDYTNLL